MKKKTQLVQQNEVIFGNLLIEHVIKVRSEDLHSCIHHPPPQSSYRRYHHHTSTHKNEMSREMNGNTHIHTNKHIHCMENRRKPTHVSKFHLSLRMQHTREPPSLPTSQFPLPPFPYTTQLLCRISRTVVQLTLARVTPTTKTLSWRMNTNDTVPTARTGHRSTSLLPTICVRNASATVRLHPPTHTQSHTQKRGVRK